MTTQTLIHSEHHDSDSRDIFGFWIYVMSDCILFSILFATYIVLHNNTYGGPPFKQLISLPYVLGETLFLLASNFAYGMAILGLYKKQTKRLIGWLIVTFLLGLGFVTMEIKEFMHLVQEGHSWKSSGALSAFFTLVGTHGLHVSLGLIWILLSIVQVSLYKVSATMKRRLTYLGLFWNFLDIVWIFLFTIVYLMGAI